MTFQLIERQEEIVTNYSIVDVNGELLLRQRIGKSREKLMEVGNGRKYKSVAGDRTGTIVIYERYFNISVKLVTKVFLQSFEHLCSVFRREI